MFGRERIIGAPRKWFDAPRHQENKVAAHYYFTQGLRSALFRLVEPVMAYFFYRWPRDIANQKGLAIEDFWVHQDRELRREYLFEMILRQSCHPYQHLMFKRRRARYYKVERAVRGFLVPDYLKKEAENRLLCDTADVKEEWEEHIYKNYYSDMTPSTRYTAMHRLIPLEVFNVYGLFREEAWERYFYNEAIYDAYESEDFKIASNPFPQYNLETDEGRRAFESEVHRFIELYPGSIVKEGEQFNFKEFYAKWAIGNGKDTSRMDPKLVEELRQKISAPSQVSSWYLPAKKVGKSILGDTYPERLQSKHRKVMM
jgi:hypothetical protein